MARHDLRVSYRRSGGIAGLDFAVDAAASDVLDDDQVSLAQRLLDQPPPSSAASEAPAGADRFSYRLHLTDGEQEHSFSWAESDVPDEVRPLLTALHRRATPVPPS